MSSRKCQGCNEFFSIKLSNCPSCGAQYAGGQPRRAPAQGREITPGLPCDCGKPQAAAVIVNRMKIPKCIDCYRAWWTPERIRDSYPGKKQ